MNVLKYFMWGYQPHFRISVQVTAEGIFSKLDDKLKPKVFLVGVLVEKKENHHPICIEPDDCGYKPNSFSDVIEHAQHLEAVDEERHFFHSHPVAQENHLASIKLRALQNAILQTVKRFDEYHGVVSFCSWPQLVDGYQVCVILQLNRKAFFSHYSLSRDKDERFTLATSLLNATIQEYLNQCSEALTKPEPGAGASVIKRDSAEIIRAAGKLLMYTPANACKEFDGLHGFFEACNTISSMRYEGAESIGRMLVSQRNHLNIEVILTLSSPVRMRDYRAVRKLLEMSSDEISLLSDSGYIYGLGKLVGLYDQRKEDLFTIHFSKHYTWELLHAEHVMMRAIYGQPELPRTSIDKQKFETDVHRIFPNIHAKQVAKLWEIVLEATKQKHGTMLVVSSGAKAEAERLKNQSTVIEPVQLTPQVVKLITAIDGAVLIDSDSTCYAIGVILDGLASKNGTSSRGARYNSAIRYVETSNHPCMAIVVSADGSIDLVPDLMPQIHRSSIIEAIETLRNLKEEENFDLKKFNITISWISDHKFYLLPEMCEEINSLRREIEVIRDRLEPTAIRIIHSDFHPNEEMNVSYFFDEEE